MVLLACMKSDERRVLAIMQPPAEIFAELLHARAAMQPTSDAEAEVDQWLRILVMSLCSDSRRLGTLYDALCDSASGAPTVKLGVLFHLLADAVDVDNEQSERSEEHVRILMLSKSGHQLPL